MNIVLLSGGSGKRLWPLSNDLRSKQFIRLFQNGGHFESMLQRVYRQIRSVDRDGNVIVTASQEQVASIRNQIGKDVNICIEPCRRDTFPAIVLAAAYLHDVEKLSANMPIVVCPVDPFVNEDYFEALKKLSDLADAEDKELTLMGIEPTYPSEKYGYIIPESDQEVCMVKAFKEKPGKLAAQEYISNGALWNGGVFAFKLDRLLKWAHQIIGFSGYNELYDKYDNLEKISFDYALVEKAENIQVMRFSGEWKDVGTWNTLSEVMEKTCVGNVFLDEDSKNTHVVNELDIPILCMGMRDTVVAASPQGILVSDKDSSSFIKPYVDKIDNQIMFAEKTWGFFKILDARDDSVTIKVMLKEGKRMNYHSHEKRDEVWTVISGKGRTIIDGKEQDVRTGNVITLHAGVKHTILAKTELILIEVQMGREITVKDKKVYNLEK